MSKKNTSKRSAAAPVIAPIDVLDVLMDRVDSGSLTSLRREDIDDLMSTGSIAIEAAVNAKAAFLDRDVDSWELVARFETVTRAGVLAMSEQRRTEASVAVALGFLGIVAAIRSGEYGGSGIDWSQTYAAKQAKEVRQLGYFYARESATIVELAWKLKYGLGDAATYLSAAACEMAMSIYNRDDDDAARQAQEFADSLATLEKKRGGRRAA